MFAEQFAIHGLFHDAAQGEIVAAQQSARAEDHHQHQHQRIDHHAVALKAAGSLGQDGQHGSGQNGAQHGAHAAQHHHDKDLDGLHKAEGGGVQHADVAGVQAARQACEGSGEGKGHHLIIGGLDAAALGGDLVVADGQHSTAVAALHHGVDEETGDDHAQEHVGKVGILGDVFQTLGAVEQLEAQHIINVVQGDADDLAKAQRQDGQIVAGQAQGGDADKHPEQPGDYPCQHQTDGKGDALGQARGFGEQGAGIGTHRHKTGMTQRQLPQITGGNVQRDGQNDIDAHGQQHLILVGGQHIAGHIGKPHEQQPHQHQIHQVAHGHFEGLAFDIHRYAPLHLFLHLAAKEARGLDQQHDDQNCKRNSVLPSGKADGGNKALAQADGNAADHGTRDGADAAQHGGDEGFQTQHGAHGGGGLRIGAAVQHAADARQRRAHGKGKGDGAVDVDAHQAGSIHILRNGAHGLAELSLLHQKGEHQHGQHGDHQRDDGGKAQRHLAQTEGLVGVVGGDHLCTRAEDQLCRVLQKEGDTNGGDQQRDTGCAAQGGVGDLFDHHAQQRTGDNGGAHSSDRAETQLVHDEPRHVCAHHDDIAVGKVQQQDNAVHHAVAQCDQCIDAAKGQAVDQLAKEHCHGWILPFFAAFTLFDIKNGERLTRKKLFRRSPKKSWGLLCAGGSITGGWNSADQNISFSSGLPST